MRPLKNQAGNRRFFTNRSSVNEKNRGAFGPLAKYAQGLDNVYYLTCVRLFFLCISQAHIRLRAGRREEKKTPGRFLFHSSVFISAASGVPGGSGDVTHR